MCPCDCDEAQVVNLQSFEEHLPACVLPVSLMRRVQWRAAANS